MPKPFPEEFRADVTASRRTVIRRSFHFDEAESALSFNGCLMLLSHIRDLLAHGSQVIISTHSPILASLPEAAGDCSSMPRRDTCGTSVLRGLLSAYD